VVGTLGVLDYDVVIRVRMTHPSRANSPHLAVGPELLITAHGVPRKLVQSTVLPKTHVRRVYAQDDSRAVFELVFAWRSGFSVNAALLPIRVRNEVTLEIFTAAIY
jgi:hypothetical protein